MDGVVREERASLRRAGPSPDPRRPGRSAEGNRVASPGPCPPRGCRPAPGSPRSLPYHLSKDLTTKEEPGRKSGGGEIQSRPSPSEEGVVSSSCPLSSFCEFLEATSELAPDAPQESPENAHSGTDVHTHTHTLVHPAPGTRRHAQRLPSSFQTARVTVQVEGNTAVPLRFPGRPKFLQAAAPSRSPLPSASPPQLSPRSAFPGIPASSPE